VTTCRTSVIIAWQWSRMTSPTKKCWSLVESRTRLWRIRSKTSNRPWAIRLSSSRWTNVSKASLSSRMSHRGAPFSSTSQISTLSQPCTDDYKGDERAGLSVQDLSLSRLRLMNGMIHAHIFTFCQKDKPFVHLSIYPSICPQFFSLSIRIL